MRRDWRLYEYFRNGQSAGVRERFVHEQVVLLNSLTASDGYEWREVRDKLHPCCVIVHGQRIKGVGFIPRLCKIPGTTVERAGKWYCGNHDPVRVAAREAREEELRRQAGSV